MVVDIVFTGNWTENTEFGIETNSLIMANARNDTTTASLKANILHYKAELWKI